MFALKPTTSNISLHYLVNVFHRQQY